MKLLVVLNRFFYPDHSATSQILTDLVLQFAASGKRSLAAIAGQSDDGGISIHRIPTTRFGRSGLATVQQGEIYKRWSSELKSPSPSGPRGR